MNVPAFLATLLCVSVLWVTPAVAASETAPLPELPLRGYVLLDHHSGAILAEQNARESMEPASITKLMSAYVIFRSVRDGAIALDDQVLISENAWRTKGSRMFVEVGSRVSVDDLIMGMVIQSGNDATVALAEYVAGSEEAFAALMNQYAAQLGLTSSNFVNSTGLPDEEHLMTAYDIGLLVQALINEFPEYYQRYSIREFTYNDITQHNRNRLLWQDDSVDGVKTGYTRSAGYCLASSASRDGMRLIAVVLGAEDVRDRFSASRALLNYGFRFYETHRLYQAAQPLTQIRIWKGATAELPLGLATDLYVTVPRGQYDELQASLQVSGDIMAPVTQGQVLGELRVVQRDGVDLINAPLISLQAVPEAGFFGRMMDQMLMTFYDFF